MKPTVEPDARNMTDCRGIPVQGSDRDEMIADLKQQNRLIVTELMLFEQ